MKKIFVTGGSGFIGSNFIIKQIMIDKNAVLNYDLLTYSGNNDNLISIENNYRYKFIKGDVSDYDTLDNALCSFEPDYIVHFAAESHVDRSIDSPSHFIQTNIIGTSVLLRVLKKYYKKNDKIRLLHISTDEVYGSLGPKGYFTEKSSYSPNSPYSATKASSDHLARAWFHTYKLPILITNCSNNYGPFQFPEKLIPLMIANCLDHKPLPIYGNGENIRDWLYVEDHCNAISQVLEYGKIGETYNIGGNNEIKNIDIVTKICSILDELIPIQNKSSYMDLITFVKDRPGHDYRYAIDSSKIQNELNWKPNESFETGIYKTIEWYLENERWWREIQKKYYNQERLGLKGS